MDDQGGWLKAGYTLMAAISGSVTGLAFMDWEKMSVVRVRLVLFVGTVFGIFVTPLVASQILGITWTNAMLAGAMTYMSSAGAFVLIPKALAWYARHFGDDK